MRVLGSGSRQINFAAVTLNLEHRYHRVIFDFEFAQLYFSQPSREQTCANPPPGNL